MSESRGLTLRKKKSQKRPTISAPQQSRPGVIAAPSGSSNLSIPRERPAQSETSDLVKRRYSTRYNQLPQFGNDVPEVPSLPGAGANNFKRRSVGGSPSRPSSAHSQHPLKVDQSALANPSLNHDAYVKDLLNNASQLEIDEYQTNLRRVKHRASLDLQQNVYQNRAQFIKISKEAEKLHAEMTMLKGLMSELTTALDHSNAAASLNPTDSTARARKAANRSSVANLEAMWNTQLQTLWKTVEKSQKFLPAVPGRHVLMENMHWIELDSATWKPRRPVAVVLLNDHLLVASKKRKKVDPNLPQAGPAPTKLVAEECWPLSDIDVTDMAASLAKGATKPEDKAVAGALIVRSGNRSWTYRHEKRDEAVKNSFLTEIRKAQEDLRKASLPKPVNETRASRQDLNYFAARDANGVQANQVIDEINSAKSKPEILVEVDGRQQNLRWVESQVDELDIDIALQHSEVAVAKVEKLRAVTLSMGNKNNIARDLINLKVDERAARLASVLLRDLVDTPSFVEATKRTTALLTRLGFEDRARQAYLSARSDALNKQSRRCVFDGDLHKYVFSISYVFFTMIKNTVQIFQASFTPGMMSACIKWAGGHLEVFNGLLVRQLSVVEGKLRQEVLDVVWQHEKGLEEVGLNFREVIGRGL